MTAGPGAAPRHTTNGEGQSGHPVLLVAYVAGLAVAAGAVAVALAGTDPPGKTTWGILPVLAGLLVAAEYLLVRFRYHGEVNALNLVEAALAPVLFGFAGPAVVATVVVAEIVASAGRRNAPVKAAFNTAQWGLAAGIGAAVVAGLAPRGDLSLGTVAAIVAALAVIGLFNQMAFSVALALRSGRSLRSVLAGLRPVVVPGWLGGWVLNSTTGILFVLAYDAHPLAVVLFPIPLVVLHLAYRGYAGARSDRMRLAGLHRAARALGEPVHGNEAVEAFLAEVAACFEARAAELVLITEGGRWVHTVVTGERPSTRFEEDGTVSLEGMVLDAPAATRITPGDRTPASALLAARGWRDCLAAPLPADEGVRGAMLVFDQAGLEGFEAGELAIIEALARASAGMLAKGRLLAAVVEERRKLAEIVETTSDGIFTIDAEGRVRSWNPALERITKVSADLIVGAPDGLSALRPRRVGGTPVALGEWARGVVLPTDLVVTDAEGRSRRLSCSYSEAGDGQDTRHTLVVVARDVTPVAEMEELRRRYGRLAEAEAAQRAVVDQLQDALTPGPLTVPGLEVGVSHLASEPAAPTGGDLYDWQLLPGGALHLAVVDVLGHGVAATKDALTVVHTLRLLALDGCALEDIVFRADTIVSAHNPELVATVVVARYDPATGAVRVASGGHPPALLVSAGRQVRPLDAHGGAIGWPAAGSDGVVEAQLGPGDSLVLYTDGLVEARKDIVEGMGTLRAHAARVAHLPAHALAAGLLQRSLAGAARRDDALALVLRRTVSDASHSRSWTATAEPREVARIRRALGTWVGEHGVPAAGADDVVVVAGELLANAVTAARTQVSLTATCTPGAIVLEVVDDGRGWDYTPPSDGDGSTPLAEAGRGLALVRALVDDLSVRSGPAGSVVRCVVPVAPPEAPAQYAAATATATE